MAFTLTEVLVVIAIMAVLGIICMSVYERAIDTANEAACVGQLHFYGNAVLAGIADHDGMLLPPKDSGGDYDCSAFVGPYLTSDPVCPVWRRSHAPGTYPYGGSSYAINLNIPQYFPQVETIPLPPNRVVLASESYSGDFFSLSLHLDMCLWGTDASYYSPAELEANAGDSRPPQYHGPINRRGLNMFMLDGSAFLVSPDTGSFAGPSATYGTAENSGYYYSTGQFENPYQ